MDSTGSGGGVGNENLKNETPAFLTDLISTVVVFLESYGWFILLGLILCYVVYEKYAEKLEHWKRSREIAKEDAILKKNPEKAYELQVSVEQARMKLQEKVKQDALERKKLLEQKEEDKRRKNIEDWEAHKQGKGYHSKSKQKDTKEQDIIAGHIKPKNKNKLRNNDYNPLMGSGGSCGYRPSRRGGPSAGG